METPQGGRAFRSSVTVGSHRRVSLEVLVDADMQRFAEIFGKHLSYMREKIVVNPPTIFCRILHVLPSNTVPECRWAVTVADGQGLTLTVVLASEELQTYERFQAALLRETGSPFRDLPVQPQPAPTRVRQRHSQDAAVATSASSGRQEASITYENIACQTSDDSPW